VVPARALPVQEYIGLAFPIVINYNNRRNSQWPRWREPSLLPLRAGNPKKEVVSGSVWRPGAAVVCPRAAR
jgi:hypothetical protein